MKSYQPWGYLLLIASLSAIFVATISPFNFIVPEGFSGQYIVEEFTFGSGLVDYLQNVLLFIPLGISLAIIVARFFKLRIEIILIVGLLCSTIISSTVELTQFLLPTRVSNITDIIYNSVGGLLGSILYCWRSNIIQFIIGIITADRQKISLKSLLIAIASYCLIVGLGILVLANSANLSNWNDDYYLAIGNEVTGDRPWNGYINNLYIGDRSLSQVEIEAALTQTDTFFAQLPSAITSFSFSEGQKYYQDERQQISNLLWQHESSIPQINYQDRLIDLSEKPKVTGKRLDKYPGILVKPEQWLKTAQPVSSLTKKLKDTDEFTIFFNAATQEIDQIGPARIMSLSKDIYAQNMIIGQERKKLNFRLRTPLTGDNATQPEFIIPQVFNDYKYHKIIITFTQQELHFYVDKVERQYHFKFTPFVNFRIFFPVAKRPWIINLKNFDLAEYQYFFYLYITIPLAILILALIYFLVMNYLIRK